MKKIRKAILTAGGSGTRLRPITHTINKHLIPLANKPMIFYAIENAVRAGIEEIYINVNPGETKLQKIVGDGGHWGVRIEYFIQDGGPQGIAHVVKCAEHLIGDDPFLFYFSDNVVTEDLNPIIKNFLDAGDDARLVLTEVPDPERSGVARFSPDGKLLEIVEKPANPPSNLIMTGIMFFGPKVYFEAYQHLQKSARGEYEISGITSYLLQNGYQVGYEKIGWWKDTGVPDDLVATNSALLDIKPGHEFIREGVVDPGAHLEGNVHVGLGSTVGAGVRLVGPVMIGENCTLENCVVGPNVTIGSGSIVRQATVANSIIANSVTVDAPVLIQNSIMGERAKLVRRSGEHHRFLLGDHTHLEI